MRFPFLELPGQEQLVPRPVVPITMEELDIAPQLCLVDSGALRNRFGRWLADSAGISLTDAPEERFTIGGFQGSGSMARVDLALGEARFDAPVWFCDPWPFDFHLLGQEGFLRYFRISISVAEGWLECEAEIA